MTGSSLVANKPAAGPAAIYGRLNNANFASIAAAASCAQPHAADFASWNDNVWIVRGPVSGSPGTARRSPR